MKIVIGYLYHDLLNLYGDSGNIKCLEYHLKEQGIDVEIRKMSLNDKKDFKKIDLLYIGSGTEDNIKLALEDLSKDKEGIKNYIESNKFILATGNSIEIFGKKIIDGDKNIKGLNIFSYVTKYGTRVVKDVIEKIDLIDKEIVGFENHSGSNELDELIIKRHNFYGTYLVGPLLVRNPMLCSYLIKELVLFKDKKFKFKDENYELDLLAYENVELAKEKSL